ETTDTMTISAWINPEFNVGSPLYTILSKEYSFDLYLSNILEPARTVGFSIFDGTQWKTVAGSTVLGENWHHVVASVDGSNVSLYLDGLLEGKMRLKEGVVFDNDKLIFQESQILPGDSDLVIGAYVSTVHEEIITDNSFAGDIAFVDVYTRALTAEQVYQKYQTGTQEFYKSVSLEENVQIYEYIYTEITTLNPSHILLMEYLTFDDEISTLNPFHINLEEYLALYDEVNMFNLYRIQLEEHITLHGDATAINPFHINLEEYLTFDDEATALNPFHINLDEILTLHDEIAIVQPMVYLDESVQFNDHILALNPFVPSVNPEIQMIKSGFLITENPKFELEYYSEDDAVKIDRQEIVNAASIAKQVQANLTSTQIELLSTPGVSEMAAAIQVAGTSFAIYQLEGQVEQMPEDAKAEDINQLREKVEEITESIEMVAEKLEETQLQEMAEEIERSAEIIRESADIAQNVNQTGTWQTTDETITTKILAPDGSIFADEAFFEKEREGKFDIEVLADAVAKPGIYTIQSTVTVDQTEYTINEKFAWGLVSLNTKKSTYYPGETAQFEIVVLDSVGSPVCDASLAMSINGTTLSSGAGITPNSECGIYDSAYDTGAEGTYHVEISAISDGIQTGFETTFDVAKFVEFDIIRTAQSKIDPVHNPNKFEVVIDVTSHTDATDIQIVESVPSVFDIVSDGIVTETADGKNITWDRALQNQTAQIKYTYSVPLIFPELFPLGEAVISYGNQTFTEARPWFVANDPDFPDDWNKRLLVVNSAMVEGSADLSNFPVLVTLTDSYLPNDPDGHGIRFTNSADNAVPFEIESYSYSNGVGTLVAWVKLTVAPDEDTRFYIHYGLTDEIDPDPAADVWTNYVAVNHLHSTPDNNDVDNLDIKGSKGDDKDTWNSMGSMDSDDQVTGKINGALDFDGDNDRVCLDDLDGTQNNSANNNWNCQNSEEESSHFDARQQNRTIELWYWAQDASVNPYEALLDAGGSTNGAGMYVYNNRVYVGNWKSGNTNLDYADYPTTSQEWHHIAFVTEGASTSNTGSGKIILYYDGEPVDESLNVAVATNNNGDALGCTQGNMRLHNQNVDAGQYSSYTSNDSSCFDGMMDEFRVANSVLSADYIKTSYNTQNDPTNFVRDGIYLSESISFTDSFSASKHGLGENVFLLEVLSFADSSTTLSNIDIETLWPSKKVLSTNPSLIVGSGDALKGLPVLVQLTNDPQLSSANVGSNGEGIRFTSDGTTLIDFEIEEYDSNTNSLIAWVEIPTLSASADTYFYIHYGNDGSVYTIDSSGGVWDGQTLPGGKTYVVVNHLDNTPTPNTNNDKEMIGSLPGDDDDFGTGYMDEDGSNVVDGKIFKALDLNDGSTNDQFVCLEDDG
ncbi:MAG TPA: DUF2341 domain-containing protein, partial [Flavobacteriales bacterium]|nr:DUF2341 domain-containing protein [Flavobacteriales bacterium]